MSNKKRGKIQAPQIQAKNRPLPKIESKISISLRHLSKANSAILIFSLIKIFGKKKRRFHSS